MRKRNGHACGCLASALSRLFEEASSWWLRTLVNVKTSASRLSASAESLQKTTVV
jgi:hypothetical protein